MKFIQIFVAQTSDYYGPSDVIYALTNTGEIWVFHHQTWKKVPLPHFSPKNPPTEEQT